MSSRSEESIIKSLEGEIKRLGKDAPALKSNLREYTTEGRRKIQKQVREAEERLKKSSSSSKSRSNEDKMTPAQEAYAEGIRTGKGKPVLRNIDKGLSKATLSTAKEKRMIDQGHSDMRKAIESESKRKNSKKKMQEHARDALMTEAMKIFRNGPSSAVGGAARAIATKPLMTDGMKAGSAGRAGRAAQVPAAQMHTMPDGTKMKGAKHGMKHGGAVKGKKCRMDGIAVRGKTRAKQRSK